MADSLHGPKSCSHVLQRGRLVEAHSAVLNMFRVFWRTGFGLPVVLAGCLPRSSAGRAGGGVGGRALRTCVCGGAAPGFLLPLSVSLHERFNAYM